MNRRLGLGGWILGVGMLLAPTVAAAQSSRSDPVPAPGENVVPRAAAQRHPKEYEDSREYVTRVYARMDGIDQDLRAGVARGRVDPSSLSIFARQRARVEQQISFAAADGILASAERRSVDQLVDRMENIERRYPNRAIGGGPRSSH
jgi:hypothetical protein